jgi:hypothetical protein
MKKLLLGMALIAAATTSVSAQIDLSGVLSTQTLSAPCYILRGCVYVPSGVTLTINPGTVIYGDTLVGAEGALIIERGGKIIADGYPGNVGSPNPIVFTSLRPAGRRAPGDWGGIIIAGNGPNNRPGGTFTVEGPCTPVIAGGTDCADNSGIFRYVQIHYAGVDASSVPGGGNEINSLTLCAVGNATTIDHVQVTYANDDAFEWFGGCVNTKYLIAYNTKDDDFDTDFGFNGKSQFGFSLRKDLTQNDISGSNGIESDNNPDATLFLGTPKTRPVFSNYSLFGPKFCNPTAIIPANFRAGAHIRRNSAHSVYNSVITGWPTFGLFVQDTMTIANTALATGALNFSYNTLSNNTTNFTNTSPTTWLSGCSATMTDWLNFANAALPACRERGNTQPAALTGLNAAICNDNCTGAAPQFTLETLNNLGDPNFTASDLTDAFFDNSVNFRGAFGATDWTLGWTEWCPQDQEYTCSAQRAQEKAINLQLVPNPSSSTTYAVFNVQAAGKVTISILDKVTGYTLRTVNASVAAGEQRIAFDVSGLHAGVYTVRVETAEGVLAKQLMVK